MVSSFRYISSVYGSITWCIPVDVRSVSVSITWCLPVEILEVCL